jgi:microcystin-dependent protein
MLKRFLMALACSSGMAAPATAGPDPYLGEIMLIPFNFCPRGTLTAEGQELSISSNEALFSLLGTTYGGDGRTTFKLPDFTNGTPYQTWRYCIAIVGVYPSRS